jgi:hypothetical protein
VFETERRKQMFLRKVVSVLFSDYRALSTICNIQYGNYKLDLFSKNSEGGVTLPDIHPNLTLLKARGG